MPSCRLFFLGITSCLLFAVDSLGDERPNVFIAISDDQSWPHASAYGSTMVQTPTFDDVARRGALFTNAFCASPGCSPSRAALLTGLHTWMIEHAGTHASYFPSKHVTFPDKLRDAGYFIGYTGKGWGPGNWNQSGRPHNPAGPTFSSKVSGSSKSGYVAAFEKFLHERPADQPFYFWFGSGDAHRPFKKDSGLDAGKKLKDAQLPAYLPDSPEVRRDLLDYAVEIERFDSDLGQMLALLDDAGELDNTLVIVTSDNGMAFPRAKANCYEDGIHVPLAICWPQEMPGKRTIDDLVGFVDLSATVYDAAQIPGADRPPLVGRSMMEILTSDQQGVVEPTRTEVFAARERHSSSRFNTLSYPQRCIRTRQYLYIRNFKPERWPAGEPQKYSDVSYTKEGDVVTAKLGPMHSAYHDIDACLSLDYMIAMREDPDVSRLLNLAVAKRPAEELFDVQKDPSCLTNLSSDSQHRPALHSLRNQLNDYLTATNDPRVLGNGDVWETYPRVSGLRWFPQPEWAKQQPQLVPRQDWLEARRPFE